MPDNVSNMFQMPAQQRSQMGGIADALMGFGAGVQGRGTQHAQYMTDREEKLSKTRLSDATKDLLQGRNLVRRAMEKAKETGELPDLTDFYALGTDRVSQIQQLGGDPKDTLAAMEQVSVDPAGYLKEADEALYMAEAAGMIKLPKDFAADGAAEVQSSKQYPDGTFVSVMKDGTRTVRGPEGKLLKGKEAAKAVRTAQEYGVDIQTARAGGRTAGTLSAREGLAAYKTVGQIRSNIRTTQKAIDAIDEGANTGAFARLLPSMKTSTLKLEQAGKELGLDVVGSVTFGALSQGELDLAMSIALPTQLDEPELRQWLLDRQSAQRKLANYYEEAAEFLSTPGNTIGKWVEKGRERRESVGASVEDVLNFDAQGNLIQ